LAGQICWEDVAVGDELPAVELAVTPKRLHLQTSGSQDWYPVHFDAAFARKSGHKDVFVNTGFIHAALVRVITDWIGGAGFLRRLKFEMRRQHRLGDVMVCRARVTAKAERDGQACVDLDVWAENEREGIATPGEATVILPRRDVRRDACGLTLD
jgi:acyl dehydratase